MPEAPAFKNLRPGAVTVSLLSLDLLVLFVVFSDAAYAAEKLIGYGLLVGITLLLTCALSDLYAESRGCRRYVRFVCIAGAMLTLFGIIVAPDILDRKIVGLKVYTLAVSQSSLQEEVSLTIYQNHIIGREEMTTEFFDNGYGSCKPEIRGSDGGLRIGIDCD